MEFNKGFGKQKSTLTGVWRLGEDYSLSLRREQNLPQKVRPCAWMLRSLMWVSKWAQLIEFAKNKEKMRPHFLKGDCSTERDANCHWL